MSKDIDENVIPVLDDNSISRFCVMPVFWLRATKYKFNPVLLPTPSVIVSCPVAVFLTIIL